MTTAEALKQPKINGLILVGFPIRSKKDGTRATEHYAHFIDEKTGQDIWLSESQIARNIALAESDIFVQHDSSAISFKDLIKQWENTKVTPHFSHFDLETLLDLQAGMRGQESSYNNGNKPILDGIDKTLI